MVHTVSRLAKFAALPLAWFTWLAEAASLLAGVAYFWQSWFYAHTQASLLDEGAYLVKGYLFVTGEYRLYQDFGPWSNHMPLAFLIPGWAQLIFGPGLRSGRYLAIAFGVMILLGLWMLARRLGGRWWGALAVWALALNPAVIKLYSLANSQALIAALLVWVLVLVVGEERPAWQLLAGSALAGLLLVTRVNLAPVVFLILIYILWMYGWRMAALAALAGALPVLVGHALYWPGILRVWAHWIPVELAPFLRPFAHPPGSAPNWAPEVTLDTRLASFFHGLRFHFVALVGALVAWIAWPRREAWPSVGRYKTVVFLSVLLGSMFIFHMWAALGNNYCVFCFPVYLSFFSFAGLLIVVITSPLWEPLQPAWRQVLAVLAILFLSTGIGFGAFAEMGERLLPVLDWPVPRMRSMRILPGTIPLGGLLENMSGLDALAIEQLARRILPALVGLLIGILVLLLAGLLARALVRRQHSNRLSYGSLALALFLGLGYLLAPTRVLGGGYNTYDCRGDVIAAYETAGAHLAQLIPPGSLVYWRGGDSAIPLLYLDGVQIFPAQINGDYSLRKGGDPQALSRYGFWSEELGRQWAGQADFILIEEHLFEGWLAEYVEAGGHNELLPTPGTALCRGDASIHIYKKRR
ncbi:MAG TPA: glycosyltransferase family 39 protein [Anaerolineales bacterium]|nr:glycosyltransferase family 39 protein [Anaerolineales bacterium]